MSEDGIKEEWARQAEEISAQNEPVGPIQALNAMNNLIRPDSVANFVADIRFDSIVRAVANMTEGELIEWVNQKVPNKNKHKHFFGYETRAREYRRQCRQFLNLPDLGPPIN